MVIASARRNIPLVCAKTLEGTVIGESATAGSNYERFYLVFGEEYFFDGEVIHGNLNEVYPMRIIGEPKKEGTQALYLVELMNGSSEGIPGSRLQAGEKFSAEYAPVERELSRKVGGRLILCFLA